MAPGRALFTDYYELAMLRAYVETDMRETATFSLFVRNLPPERNYLLACGLETALVELEALRFADADIRALAALGDFPESFLSWLRAFRFTGDIVAMKEGTPFFAEEPILEVTAPIAQAQLLETLLLNQIGLQTLIASKAARIVAAAEGRMVADFGARRAQGFDAATKGARAAFVAGVDATSNVEAALAFGIPLSGTMAHSFIEACDTESEAFAAFTKIFPQATLLVDTYDTLGGVERAISLARKQALSLRAVRLDSGDLSTLSALARALLDAAGLTQTRIIASGGLDEYEIARLVAAGAPIDVFGVGTELAVSADAPALDIVYKLTEYAGAPRMKLSAGKRSLPGPKQVWRRLVNGFAAGDTITLRDEEATGAPLLFQVMRGGRRIETTDAALQDSRAHARKSIALLPAPCRGLAACAPYPVSIGPRLAEAERETRARLTKKLSS